MRNDTKTEVKAAGSNGQATTNNGKTKKAILSSSEKPPRIDVQADNIPLALRERKQWVCWRWEWDQEAAHWDKPLKNARTGTNASSTDPKTWATFEEALSRYHAGKADGIGFVFTVVDKKKKIEGDPFVGIDIDDCRDPATGAIAAWAAEDIKALDSYAEVSPSGTGVKVFVEANLPQGGRRKGNHEFYPSGRYFTVTGNKLVDSPDRVEHRQSQLDQNMACIFGALEMPKEPSRNGNAHEIPFANGAGPASGKKHTLTDEEVLYKAINARNGAAVWALWSGIVNDHSADDLSLCNHLAFFCGGDTQQVDRLFRQSCLMRPKWDKVHYSSGETYGQHTVAKAHAGRTAYYDPEHHEKKKAGANGKPSSMPPLGPLRRLARRPRTPSDCSTQWFGWQASRCSPASPWQGRTSRSWARPAANSTGTSPMGASLSLAARATY